MMTKTHTPHAPSHPTTPNPGQLTCPGCGNKYDNYTEYFACWTGHLGEKMLGGKTGGLAPYTHNEAVVFYSKNPEYIEQYLRIVASEVGVFHGRIDLIGVDRKKQLVLIDVDYGHDLRRKSEQLRRYKNSIQWMATRIFGLRVQDIPPIRLVIVNPNKYVKEVETNIKPSAELGQVAVATRGA